MFENLTERLENVFKQLRRRGKLSESDVDAAMREVRLALLEADVNYAVAKDFVARVRQRAVGQEVSRALNPGQQVVKIVNEELITTLGALDRLNLSGPRPRAIMLVGLQGSGKTTAAGKLARMLRSQGERVMLVACDPYRPAAVRQLETLGERLNVPVHFETGVQPPELAARAHDKAQKGGFTVLLLDTAGRSQLDEALMSELQAIKRRVDPVETLLVVDAMIGQESVNIAKGFREVVPTCGVSSTLRRLSWQPRLGRRSHSPRRFPVWSGENGCTEQPAATTACSKLQVSICSTNSSRTPESKLQRGHSRYD